MIRKINLGLVIVTLFGIMVPQDRLWGADANGLIAHWKLDEGSGTIAGDSAGTNHGTIYGATWTTGQIGNALSFDGNGDYIDFGDIDEFEFGQSNFSIAFWFYTQGTHDIGGDQSGYGDIIGKYNYNLGKQWLFQQDPAGYVNFATYSNTGGGESLLSTNSYQYQWVHCVAVRNGTTKLLYINGVLNNTGTCLGVRTGVNTKVLIGAIENNLHKYHFYNGIIDDVRIYNKALSADEIWQLYLNEFSGTERAIIQIDCAITEKLETLKRIDSALEKEKDAYNALEELLRSRNYGDLKKGDIQKAREEVHSAIEQEKHSRSKLEKSVENLEDALTALGFMPEPNLPIPISHWKFDEGSGTIAYDSIGTHHGTLYNATWTTGRINGALSFDGNGDYVGIADSDDFVPSTGTITAWIKLDTWGENGFGRILCHFARASGQAYGFDWDVRTVASNFGFQIYNGVLSCGVGSTPGSLFLNTWYHVAVVWNGTNMISYVNGSQSAVSSQTTVPGNPAVDLFIGRATDTSLYDFDGIIDDVRIYNKALSAEEIMRLYQGEP